MLLPVYIHQRHGYGIIVTNISQITKTFLNGLNLNSVCRRYVEWIEINLVSGVFIEVCAGAVI